MVKNMRNEPDEQRVTCGPDGKGGFTMEFDPPLEVGPKSEPWLARPAVRWALLLGGLGLLVAFWAAVVWVIARVAGGTIT